MRGAANSLDALERVSEPVGRRRLVHEGERAALETVLALLLDRQDLHRDVARRGVLLQLVEHRPAEHVRQEHIQRDRGRTVLARERQAFRAVLRDDGLEAVVARQIQQHPRVVRIVFDDEQHPIVGLQVSRSSTMFFDARDRQRDRLERSASRRRRGVRRLAIAEPM